MSTEENKALARRYYEAGAHDLTVFDAVLAPHVVLHFPGSPAPIRGIAAAKHFHTTNSTPFAGFQITVEDQMAEGDKVVSRWVMQGTQTGDFQGLPPTGKTVQMTGISIDRIAGGGRQDRGTVGQL